MMARIQSPPSHSSEMPPAIVCGLRPSTSIVLTIGSALAGTYSSADVIT